MRFFLCTVYVFYITSASGYKIAVVFHEASLSGERKNLPGDNKELLNILSWTELN